jgi:uncharacterized membrane protein
MDERLPLERLIFFSDAVFAIALTLVVVDIRVPDVDASQLGPALLGLLPKFFSYALSFTVIASFWASHHRNFQYVERLDGPLLAWNMVLLFFVAFLPFPTSLLGEHGNVPVAAAFYAAWLTLTRTSSSMLWRHLVSGGLLSPSMDEQTRRYVTLQAIWFPVSGLVSVPIALVSPPVAYVLWLSPILIRPLARRRIFGHR